MNKLHRNNFEAFVLSNSVLFYSFAKRYVSNQYIIEDILQDCYVKLWGNIDNLGHISHAKIYMFTMIKNAAINLNKREQLIELTDNIEEHFEQEGYIPSESFMDDIFEEETNAILVKALATLPKKQRKVILLSLNGYKNSEIATLLGTTEDSVKSRKKRALKKLTDITSSMLYFR